MIHLISVPTPNALVTYNQDTLQIIYNLQACLVVSKLVFAKNLTEPTVIKRQFYKLV